MNESEIILNYEIISSIFEDKYFEKINIDQSRDIEKINSFIDQNILIQENNQIYLNYKKESNVYFKKLIDQIKFERIDLKLQNEIEYIQNLILKDNRNKIFSIFVSGSVARNTNSTLSDLDFVVIHSGKEIKLPNPINKIIKMQFITHPKKDLLLENLGNNELLIWALKHGLLIYDRNFIFKKMQAYLSSDYIYPIIVKKRGQIDFLCNTFELMFKDEQKNDINMKEMIYKILHLISRYIIFLNGDFPLSRPELKRQVQRYNKEIVNIYDFLEHDNLSSSKLVDIYFNLKKVFKDFSVSS
jgi:hypothetical protein